MTGTPHRPRVVIVDDEPPARKKLRQLLDDDGRTRIVGEAGDGLAAVALLERERPDLVLLDVQMPELDGFGVLEQLEHALPRVIFVTAYDEFALRAFDVAAVDYVLKPVERDRFTTALDRSLRSLGAEGDEVSDSAAADGGASALRRHIEEHRILTRFLVRKANRMLLVSTDDVEWMEAAKNYVRLHTADGEHLVRTALSDLEARLDPERFVRIHRSTIVNLEAVDRFEPVSHGDWDVFLRSGRRLRLSRRFRDRLEALLGG